MLSRKDFLKQCASSLGKSLFEVCETVIPLAVQIGPVPKQQPLAGGKMVAVPRNRFCRGCECSTCRDQCRQVAIKLLPGEGIQIDPALCLGCGGCEKSCPAAPSAIQLRDASEIK
jgi:NAD-dependent dihydropyrimidine dehydrogenase PreA subunit